MIITPNISEPFNFYIKTEKLEKDLLTSVGDVIWEAIKWYTWLLLVYVAATLHWGYLTTWFYLTLWDSPLRSQYLHLSMTHFLWLPWGLKSPTWEFLIFWDSLLENSTPMTRSFLLLSFWGPVFLTQLSCLRLCQSISITISNSVLSYWLVLNLLFSIKVITHGLTWVKVLKEWKELARLRVGEMDSGLCFISTDKSLTFRP